jgi:hypothetical protein
MNFTTKYTEASQRKNEFLIRKKSLCETLRFFALSVVKSPFYYPNIIILKFSKLLTFKSVPLQNYFWKGRDCLIGSCSSISI